MRFIFIFYQKENVIDISSGNLRFIDCFKYLVYNVRHLKVIETWTKGFSMLTPLVSIYVLRCRWLEISWKFSRRGYRKISRRELFGGEWGLFGVSRHSRLLIVSSTGKLEKRLSTSSEAMVSSMEIIDWCYAVKVGCVRENIVFMWFNWPTIKARSFALQLKAN